MIRPATVADVPSILELVRELATYERAGGLVSATEESLRSALFGPAPAAFAHVATGPDGAVVGFALWFLSFSTWLGRHGIYLEDLYVRPDQRGAGHGRSMLATLAGIAVERGYGRLEWSVLDWNVDAQGFYRQLGAAPQDEWTVWRVDEEGLAQLARGGR